VLVSLPDFDSNFDKTLMLGLEKALRTATIPVKALIITNPHNPLAACYPRNLLEECVKFCEKHSLQFISDEIYALSQFPNGEMTSTIPFTSVLSLNLADLEVEASRVHMLWSMSKDLGQSGLRMVCRNVQQRLTCTE
jgi:aspartate/methionine/tyrosine aminotransferase